MLDDLFVPDPPTGDSSNRIPNTRFVTVAIGSAVASVGFPSIAATTVVGNPSSATAVATAVTVSNLLDNTIGSAQGALLYRNAATWVVLAPGTNGQLLQTQGAAANPQWVGGRVLLNTLSPNGVASTNDTTSLTSTYSFYEIVLENVCPSAAALLKMQVATSGSNFISTSYLSIGHESVNGVVGFYSSTVDIPMTEFAISTSANHGFSGHLMISNPSGTLARKQVVGSGGYVDNGALGTTALAITHFMGFWNGGNNAITGVNFQFSSGNVATGTIKIYGVT